MCRHAALTTAQWRIATWGMGGSGPPTSVQVQTPPENCANPLKSVLVYRGGGGGGVPCMYIVTFYCSLAKKNCSDPPHFWAGDATAMA